MAMATTNTCTISLTSEELDELLRVLQKEYVDTHVELRRTEAPDYREKVTKEQSILQSLVAKVRSIKE